MAMKCVDRQRLHVQFITTALRTFLIGRISYRVYLLSSRVTGNENKKIVCCIEASQYA